MRSDLFKSSWLNVFSVGLGLAFLYLPILVLIAIVVAWTGPWSKLPSIVAGHFQVNSASSLAPGATVSAVFNWTPFVGGSAILASWIVVVLLFRVSGSQLAKIFATTWSQMWGAMLVGVFIFGLAYVFNYSGMAGSLAKAFSEIGPFFIIVAPLLGFIGVALSGSNTSTNAMFGKFQALVGGLLGMPAMLLPTLNSVGAEIGKPIAPQTASVGVSTSEFVRNEGEVIRHNFGWTLILLAYLVLHKNRVLTREQLTEHIWGDVLEENFDSNYVDVHIKNLRKKLSQHSNADLVETVRGIGYRISV